MDYAEVREAFFQLRDAGAPEPGTSGWQSPARRLRDAIEPIATICYWSEPAYDAYAALGLDFLQGYVWSRGCVLGEPDGGVVAAAFGFFEEATDRQLAPSRDAIGPALPGILPLLQEWSRQIIDYGWFPPDPYKRASG